MKRTSHCNLCSETVIINLIPFEWRSANELEYFIIFYGLKLCLHINFALNVPKKGKKEKIHDLGVVKTRKGIASKK